MCFIPMNVFNELFNGVRQLRWQYISPVVSTFSTYIGLLSSFFIKHCILLPSFCPSVALFLWYSIPFSELGVFPWGLEMLMFSFGNPKFFAVRHIHYPVNPSSDHFHTDAVVPSSDHCLTKTVLPPCDHYCIETVAPSGDHYGIDIVVPSSEH